MIWAHGWLSRQARESAALEDMARAAKCQKRGMKTSSRPLGPGGRCRFGQATFTGTHGNERDAP
jgi:hypothetical protein